MVQWTRAYPEFTPFGTVFQPIGEINGRKIWPILGGAEGDNGGDGSSGSGDGDSSNTGGNGTGAGDGSGSSPADGTDGSGDGSDGDGSTGDTISKDEYEKLRARMVAADRAKTAAEKKVEEFEAKNRTELENAKIEAEKARKERDEANEKLRDVAVENAFRDASDTAKPPIVWHNSRVAMSQLDKTKYEIGEDGTVKGMDKAVKALADEHAYLLKKQEQQGGKSGGSYNGPANGSGSTTDSKALARKYPAIRGRGGST